MNITVDEDANSGAPIQMDIVFAETPELINILTSMSSQEWFSRRDQFLMDHPNKDEVLSKYFEWIPGQKKTDYRVQGNGASEAVLFVNYTRSPNPNRVKLIIGQHVLLRLKESSFELRVLE